MLINFIIIGSKHKTFILLSGIFLHLKAEKSNKKGR